MLLLSCELQKWSGCQDTRRDSVAGHRRHERVQGTIFLSRLETQVRVVHLLALKSCLRQSVKSAVFCPFSSRGSSLTLLPGQEVCVLLQAPSPRPGRLGQGSQTFIPQ